MAEEISGDHSAAVGLQRARASGGTSRPPLADSSPLQPQAGGAQEQVQGGRMRRLRFSVFCLLIKGCEEEEEKK